MPKLKQPTSLQDMAMERLVKFCSQLCVTVSKTGDLDRLNRIVLFIKGYAAPHIPSQLHAEFYNAILRMLWSRNSELSRHPLDHQEIVLEIIMDAKIVGLACDFPRLPLCLSKAGRIQGLTRLKIQEKRILLSLEEFHLDNLTHLDIDNREDNIWSDEDLKLIARKCPMLEHLTISASKNVTDEGLRALAPCSRLRSFSVGNFPRTSLSGINQFLSSPWRKRDIPVFWDMPQFDNSETSVYRFIESLMLDDFPVTNEHLHSMVTKFPNLRRLWIGDGNSYSDISNWRVLSGLERLSSLEIYCDVHNAMWTNLVSLLRHIGANMRKLVIPYLYDHGYIDQDRFNLMYRLCPNIEYLDVTTSCENSILVVPKFKNLTYFKCHNTARREDGALQFSIDDGAMMKLEEFGAIGFDMDEKMLEIMMDHSSFPNLKKITIERRNEPTGKIERLRTIAKINNIDIEFDQEYWEPI